MKLIIDMNLSPEWVAVFEHCGWKALHWSKVGDPRASDHIIMNWANKNGYIVFTHDLDFGAILAITQAEGPSVIQVRTQDVTPNHLKDIVVTALRQYSSILVEGALITINEKNLRARILPISR